MRSGVISLGEALIDFIPLDKKNNHYQKSKMSYEALPTLEQMILTKVGENVE
ncbi:hypothetical protein [Metabacillus sp. B2-18]|uniref:hypothetical protein n=1 Tax=Metabacillus sp. B2-18 TaxID=2897333 RepID=UPI001E420D5F|nr:hypothetical protein [Metabacillus sp. B2-18]UGB33477.1 hypothetical protein LPC09_06370 [Metabacillus sp. B2-18]